MLVFPWLEKQRQADPQGSQATQPTLLVELWVKQ